MTTRPGSNPAPTAFTLIEVTISLVLTGVVIVAALGTLRAAAVSRGTAEIHGFGSVLAHDLLSEILQQTYEDPGPSPVFGREGGEDVDDRSTWNDVDDYRGLDSLPPRSRAGTERADAVGWRRVAAVTKVEPGTLAPLSDNATDAGLRMVTVTVTSPGGRVISLSAIRADVRDLETPPMLDTAYVEVATVTLQLEPQGTPTSLGVEILNHRRPSSSGTTP